MQVWKNSEELWNSNDMFYLLGYNRVHVTLQLAPNSGTQDNGGAYVPSNPSLKQG